LSIDNVQFLIYITYQTCTKIIFDYPIELRYLLLKNITSIFWLDDFYECSKTFVSFTFIFLIYIPLRLFIWLTAIRSMVNLSGFRASDWHAGTMSESSVMYAVILFRRRLSISQWFSLQWFHMEKEKKIRKIYINRHKTTFYKYY